MEQFELNPRSWLGWAQTNDLDRYEAAQEAGALKKGSGRVETFEWSELNSQMNRLITEVANLSHITAVKGTKAQRKKFKAPKLSWPATALDGLKDRARARREEATKAFLAMFEPVPQAQWEAEMAEHKAALEAGARQSPVQERALAEAAQSPDPPPS